MTDWATATDVENLTGAVVTEDDIARAQFIIELFADTTTESSDAGMISSRNLRLLMWATAYQTAWMPSQPDLFTHVGTEGIGQDGVSAQYDHANAALLAPLARRCINRLSWKMHPLRVQPPRAHTGHIQPEFGSLDNAVADDDRAWIPYRS